MMTSSKSIPHQVLLLGLFAIPFIAFITTPGLLFPAITGKAFAFRILVEVLFLSWVCFAIQNKEIKPQGGSIVVVLLVYLLAAGLSTITSENPYRSFWSNYERMDGYISLVHFFVYFLLASALLKAQKDWERLWYFFIASSVIVGGFNLYEIFVSLNETGTVARMGSTFGNPTYLAVFMLFLLFINVYLFIEEKIHFWIFAPIALIQLVVIYFTGTRGAILGLFGGLGLAGVIISIWGKAHAPRLRQTSLVALFGLVLITGSFIYAKETQFVQNSPVLSRFAAITITDVEKQDARLFVWPMAVEGFKDRPLLGWGQESFVYVFNEHYDPRMTEDDWWFDKVHNIVLEWLVAGGLLGLMAYLAIYVVAIYTLWKNTPISFVGKSILTGLFAAYFIQNLVVFDILFGSILFFTLLAYLHRLSLEHTDTVRATVLSSPAKIMILGLSGLIVVSSLYVSNYKPIRASQAHVQAIKALNEPGGLPEFMRTMESALSYNTFGRPVFIEQLARAAPLFLQPDTPKSLQRSYFNLTDREFEKYLAKDPSDTLLRVVYGLFLSRFDQNDRALAQYHKALELSPQRQSTWLTVGAIYLDKERYEEAVTYFRHAYELEPRFNKSRMWYGISLVYAGNKKLANTILGPVAVATLVADDRLIDAHIAQENHAELVPLFLERVKQTPDDPQANVSLAVAYLRSERFEDAALVLEFFLVRNPNFEQDLRFYIEEIKAGRDPSL